MKRVIASWNERSGLVHVERGGGGMPNADAVLQLVDGGHTRAGLPAAVANPSSSPSGRAIENEVHERLCTRRLRDASSIFGAPDRHQEIREVLGPDKELFDRRRSLERAHERASGIRGALA